MDLLVKDMVKILNEMAPPRLAEDWDNVGLLVGRMKKPARVILCSLDFSKEVLEQAQTVHADLIVTHHPAIFKGIRQLTDLDWQTALLLQAAQADIAVYSAHTNLDSAVGGVNDILAALLELTNVEALNGEEDSLEGLGRIGQLATPLSAEAFAQKVKKALRLPYVTLISAQRPVSKAAVCGGSGMSLLNVVAASGADTFVTGDIHYHDAQDAVGKNINLIDATHQGTELPVANHMADRLSLRLSKENSAVKVLVAKETTLMRIL